MCRTYVLGANSALGVALCRASPPRRRKLKISRSEVVGGVSAPERENVLPRPLRTIARLNLLLVKVPRLAEQLHCAPLARAAPCPGRPCGAVGVPGDVPAPTVQGVQCSLPNSDAKDTHTRTHAARSQCKGATSGHVFRHRPHCRGVIAMASCTPVHAHNQAPGAPGQTPRCDASLPKMST